MTEKVKDFIKNHKKTILIGVGVVTGLALGIYGTNKFMSNRRVVKTGVDLTTCLPYDDIIAATLKDARATHPGSHATRGFIFDVPVGTDDLGILGKIVSEKDGRKNQTFTHFIAIGESIIDGK